MTATSTAGNAQIADALTAAADGTATLEAAVMLLGDSGCWLDREDFTSKFTTSVGSACTPAASIDWEAAIAGLDAGELPCSSGEQRVLRLAASIATGIPVGLSDILTGIGKRNALLALQAVAHAAGQTWLTDGTMEEHARLLTRLDNFLRTSPAVMDALTAFMAEDTGLPNPGYAASLLIAEVSFAALWHHQIAGHGSDGLAERIGIRFP